MLDGRRQGGKLRHGGEIDEWRRYRTGKVRMSFKAKLKLVQPYTPSYSLYTPSIPHPK